MVTIVDMLHEMAQQRAQSLQFRPGEPPFMVVRDARVTLDLPALTARHIHRFFDQLLSDERRSDLQRAGQVDGEYQIEEGHTFQYRARLTENGPAIAFRGDWPLDVPAESPPPIIDAAASTVTAPTGGEFAVAEHTFDGLLHAVIEQRASDLILSAGRPARVRVAGDFWSVPWAVFDDEAILSPLGDLLTPKRQARLAESGSVDVAIEVQDATGKSHRFRVNVFRQFDGLAAAWRPILERVPSFHSLGLPESLSSLVELPYGLVLLTGPTGAGKSTTLASMIEHLNTTAQRHIITLEDPIEYRFRDQLSMIHQREVGMHVDGFAQGLRAALREAPDVILVGEMRDLDTISAALTAAETGHLVLSTLHAGTSVQAIDRIIDVFPENQQQQVRAQLSDCLRAIVAQRLLPTPSRDRVAAIELVMVNLAVSACIRDRRTHQLNNVIVSGRAAGMIPFDYSLSQLVAQGRIDPETALRAARDPGALQKTFEK